MPSSPLNPHPQDAVAGHDAKSGIGPLQRAAGVRPGEHHLIEHGYVPVRQLVGKVVGVWGDAHIRHLDGTIGELHAGYVIKKGEVVLTGQDGIVQLEASHAPQYATANDDVERVIAQVGQGDADVVPAAGPNGGGAAGSLEEGLRVGRDTESVTPAAPDLAPLATPVPTTQPQAVAPLETAPVGHPDTETTAADTPVVFDPRANDASSSGLTIVAVAGHPIGTGTPVTLPQGTVTLNADGTLTFTPNHGVDGSISFTYTDQDAAGGTATSTVTVVVAPPVDHAPIAVADTFAGTQDTPLAGALAGNDTPSADGGNAWSLAAGPAHGAVTVHADGTFTYVPAAHYSGADSFAYTITDVDGSTSTATVTLNMAPVPLAAPDTFVGTEDATIQGSLAANDTPSADGTSAWTLASGAAHGSVVVDPDGTFTYTPAANYNGPDSFTYTVTDAAGSSSTATVTLDVTPVDDAPAVRDDTATTPFGAPVTIAVLGNDTDVDGDPLAITAVGGQPIAAGTPVTLTDGGGVAEGTVTLNPDGTLTFTPAPGYSGPVDFPYTVSDGTDTSTANIHVVVGADRPPVAVDDTLAGTEDTPLTIAVLANDTDPEGDPLTITAINGSSVDATHPVSIPQGVVSLNPDGTLTFTPAPDYNGPAGFDYTVSDGHGNTSTATVAITIAPVDDAPVAVHDAYTTNEDTPFTFTPALTGNDTDVDGDTLTVTQIDGVDIDATRPVAVANGVVSMDAGGALSFTPAADYNGPSTFTYTTSDGHGGTSTATVDVTVVPVDDAPVAHADTYSGAEDTPVVLDPALTANDTDADGDALAVTQIDGKAIDATHPVTVANGVVSMDASGVLTFTPDANYNGTTTFAYTVSDGHGATSTATATVNVAAVNDAPVAHADTYDATEGIPVVLDPALTANDTDADGDTLAVTRIDGQAIDAAHPVTVANGLVSMDASGALTFTPGPLFSGTTSFTYTVSDGHGGTSTATATVAVSGVNHAPAAHDDTYNGTEDTVLAINPALTANDSDIDGDTLAVTQIDGKAIDATHPVTVANGTVSMDASGALSFAPDANYNGTTTFTYTVTDGHGTLASATATVHVAPVNDAPVANSDNYNGIEDTPLTINPALTANDSDADGDTLTVTQIDGKAIDAAHPVTVANGLVSMDASGVLTFTPNANYNGTTTFGYTVSDGHGGTSTATATVNVAPVNDAPVANNDTYNGTEDTPLTITPSLTANDIDVDGDALTVTKINGTAIDATHPVTTTDGVVSMDAAGALTFTPNADYNGTTTFDYTVSDGHGGTSTATATVNVAPVNDAPVAQNDTYNGTEDTVVPITPTLTANDADVDGDTLTVTQINGSTIDSTHAVAVDNGVVSMDASGALSFTPAANFNGATTFAYTVSDGHGGTSIATATVDIAPVNDAPVARNDTYNGTEDTPLAITPAVTANDIDVDGDALTVTKINGTAIDSTHPVTTTHGVVSMDASGALTFTPNANYNGATSFTYTVSDGHGGTSTATANVTIAAVNDAPAAGNDSYAATENAVLALSPALTANDTDVEGDALAVTRINGTAIAAGGSVSVADGVVSLDAGGVVSFAPSTGFHGATSFQYTVSDGHGGTAVATATITVAPLAAADAASVDFNTARIVDVLGNDKVLDGNNVSVATVAGQAISVGGTPVDIVSGGVHQGTVALNADGTLTFTPDPGVTGAVSFVYTVTDGTSQSAPATVSLTVDTPPVATADAYSDARGVTLVLNGAAASVNHALTSNDTDVNAGDTLTVTRINGAAIAPGGSVAVNNGTVSMSAAGVVSFTPASPAFTGSTSFTYTVYDGHGGTATATATVNVAAGNIVPVANADAYASTENTLLVLNGAAGGANHALTTNDTDANGDTLAVTQINGATLDATHSVTVVAGGVTEGTVSMNSAGVISFNPTLNYTGNASFDYTISDGHGGTSTANVSIAVAADADIPTVSASATGRWLFNEGAGTSTADAYDSQAGTLTNINTANGGTAPTWITGHNGSAGTALNFDGKGGIVSVPLADTAALSSTSTLSVWFKTTQVGSTIGWSSPSIIGSEHAGDGNDIQWGSINSTGHIGLGLGNDANGVYSATAVNDGNWHDLTITRTVNANGTSAVSVYIDGALSSSATLAAQSPATNGIPTNELAGFGYTNGWTAAGADTTVGDVYYKGGLDDARIYSHALTADQAKAVYNVENGYETQAVANDGDAIKLTAAATHSTALTVTGVEAGMVLTDGTHTVTSTGNTQAIDITGWNTSALSLTNVGTGSATLEFDATDTVNGVSHDQSTWLSVVNGSTLLGGTAGNDTLAASTSGATFISGNAGNDGITGGAGNDRLLGGTGDDTLSGGAGNDLIVGGTGTNTLTGGTGNDVFRWEFGDHGTAGSPTVDTITDFSSAAGNKDVLDLRDLLGGASHDGTQAGNVASFIHFDHAGSDTVIHISTTGGFASGYTAGQEDETIVLKNVDLTVAGTQNDQQIIHQLLVNGQLHLG